MVVSPPWPGSTRLSPGRPNRRSSDCISSSSSPPGKSVRPKPAQNSVSPENSVFSCQSYRQMPPLVCPGVPSTSKPIKVCPSRSGCGALLQTNGLLQSPERLHIGSVSSGTSASPSAIVSPGRSFAASMWSKCACVSTTASGFQPKDASFDAMRSGSAAGSMTSTPSSRLTR